MACRKAPEQEWSAPSWLPRLAGDQPASQESWLNLKLSLVRLLADLYGAKLEAEVQESGGGRQGVVLSAELPVKQARKTQDTTVDDLIKRFFVAPA